MPDIPWIEWYQSLAKPSWTPALKRKTGVAGEEVDSSAEPKSLRSTSMCPSRSSAMSTDVSTMTRISDRLYVGNRFLGRLLEHTESMLPAQGNEFRVWHSCQFRSHAA